MKIYYNDFETMENLNYWMKTIDNPSHLYYGAEIINIETLPDSKGVRVWFKE